MITIFLLQPYLFYLAINIVLEKLFPQDNIKSTYHLLYYILYLCTLFEETALYYAYRHAMFDKADIIIQNGYDYYLELSTLYLIYSYDRSSYRKYMYELKYICLKRLLEKIKYFQSAHYISSYFLSETQNICKGILKRRDVSNYNDPKNDGKRHVFKYTV